MGSAWAEVPTITYARARRGPRGADLGGGTQIGEGGWDASQGLRGLEKRDESGGARGVGRGANGSIEERAC